jgi:S1-C subfamily serine protease
LPTIESKSGCLRNSRSSLRIFRSILTRTQNHIRKNHWLVSHVAFIDNSPMHRFKGRGTWLICLWILVSGLSAPAVAATFRFIKSESGPSGKIVDNRFQFDELRNRFVYPQDEFLTVYFEWEGPPGTHVLTAYWKDPQGAVVSISPDIRMETKTPELHAYWIFQITPSLRSGIWTAEIRIDGEPSGSHNFELVVPAPQQAKPPAPPPQKFPTLDEMYATGGRSLVWVHKSDDGGRLTDTALGFVIGAGQVATAFQAIDACARLRVDFSDGRKVMTNEVWAYNRLQDWAILRADTAKVPPLRRADNQPVPVGARYIVFNVENETTRVIGGVDITGKTTVPDFGDRIQLMPSPAREAVGGPLMNPAGDVVGVVGGSVTPGSRFDRYAMSVSPSLWSRLSGEVAATPITALPDAVPSAPRTLSDLLAEGALTQPLTPTPFLVYGGSARSVSKTPNDTSTNDASEFSRRDHLVWIYTLWRKKDKANKGITSARIYDYRNRLIVDVAPKRISIPDGPPLRVAFSFGIDSFPSGVYRVDVLWNGEAAWRTFFRITD